MKFNRASGILLHITSLPGKYGGGTLGKEAYRFIDIISEAGFSYWQILPTGPVSSSMCYSPYSSVSCFAGNPLMIDPDAVTGEVWYKNRKIKLQESNEHYINLPEFEKNMTAFLMEGFSNFFNFAEAPHIADFELFRKEHGDAWLEDYALYQTMAEKLNSYNWLEWNKKIALRDEQMLAKLKSENHEMIKFHIFCQYLFYKQWSDLKKYANEKNITLIGDMPIYMSMNSADAWANINILKIDTEELKPEFVAGVPPDYFSDTGQLWGNPLYRWENEDGSLNEETYQWWLKRISITESMTDILRIDHFRAFESYWAVEYGEDTAVNGRWIKGPGMNFFSRLKKDTGHIPFIAEDLGIITPEVTELRLNLELPGMKILQFAFDNNNANEYLPHNIETGNCVLYTGTHDNNTSNGWFYGDETSAEDREYIMEYLHMKDWGEFHWRLIREAYASVADLVIIPAQDILGYGAEFRMNTPGTTENNWIWKLTDEAITDKIVKKLRRMAQIFRRLPESE